MALGSQPTSRWRRWVLLGILASIVVLAVNAAMSARSPGPTRQLAQQSYLDRVLPIVYESNQVGQDIDALRTRALSLGATTVAGRLESVVARARRTLAEAQALAVPAPLQTGHDLLIAALAIRAEGAEAFRQAMAGAISGPSAALPVQPLADAGGDFDAGDRTYALFVSSTPRLDEPLPASVWVRDPSVYQEPAVTVFLTTLRSAASLAPVHDVAVLVVTTDPAPVAMIGTTEVLPVSQTLAMQVVVADLGNQAETHVTVTATLTWAAPPPAPTTTTSVASGRAGTPAGGTGGAAGDGTGGTGGSPGVATQSVRNFADLQPGLSRTVDLGGLRPPAGVPTVLTVTVQPVAGGTATPASTKVIPFVMR
jgi:hypothetical protein